MAKSMKERSRILLYYKNVTKNITIDSPSLSKSIGVKMVFSMMKWFRMDAKTL
jgi:hypothetical protein